MFKQLVKMMTYGEIEEYLKKHPIYKMPTIDDIYTAYIDKEIVDGKYWTVDGVVTIEGNTISHLKSHPQFKHSVILVLKMPHVKKSMVLSIEIESVNKFTRYFEVDDLKEFINKQYTEHKTIDDIEIHRNVDLIELLQIMSIDNDGTSDILKVVGKGVQNG